MHRIWVTRGDRTVSEISAEQLRHATVYQGHGRSTANGLVITGTGSQPAFYADVSLDSGEGALRMLLARVVSQRLISLSAFVLFGSLVIALLALDWRHRWPIGAALIATVIAVRALPWLSYRVQFHDDVSRAVGYSSYVGLWKSRERFIQEFAAVIPVALAVLLALVYRCWCCAAPPADDAHSTAPVRALPRGIPALLVGAPVPLVALLAAPNLRLYLGPPSELVPSWDANNLVFWQYLVQKTTLEPIKDFYWLYGFQWLFDQPAPWGLLVSYWVVLLALVLPRARHLPEPAPFLLRPFTPRPVPLPHGLLADRASYFGHAVPDSLHRATRHGIALRRHRRAP